MIILSIKRKGGEYPPVQNNIFVNEYVYMSAGKWRFVESHSWNLWNSNSSRFVSVENSLLPHVAL